MQSKSFHIYQVHSQEEVDHITDALNRIPGVKSTTGDFETKIFAIQWSDPAEWKDIENAIVELDYTPETH
ncbi:MAG: cation transporter [Aggregatilineales bacterium]